MPTTPSARVLIIDNDPRVRSDLQGMLTILGYRATVAEGAGADLVAHAERLATQFRPHVAIVDLRLIDEYGDDRSGLEMLGCLRSARCILYSAYLDPELIREARRYAETCTWISKSESPRRLIDAIEEASCQVCAGHKQLDIKKPEGWTSQDIVHILFANGSEVAPDIVDDLLGQLLPSSHQVTLGTLEGTMTTPGSVGRGRSVVLKAWRDGRREPLVLKLAPAQDTLREWDNYEKHIRENLRGMYHAHLESPPVTFWDLGGMLYSFVGAASRSLPSFARFYRGHQDTREILLPLEHFFCEVWGGLYKEATNQRYPLFESYDSTLHLERRLAAWKGGHTRSSFADLPDPLPNPVSWVLKHRQDSTLPDTRHAITHGDLHGDNLFIDRSYAWAIDFERSGPGPILRDFVELEVDIVTRLIALPQDDLTGLFELAIELVTPMGPDVPFQQKPHLDGNPGMRKALGVIDGLRKLAYELIGYSDSREYLWGLLLDALFVASLTAEESHQHNRALVFAAVLCERLGHWDEPWPPSEWRFQI